jgi:predicted cobalt transporter CbtA
MGASNGGASSLANLVSTYVVNPIIAIIFAAGLLVFIFGVVQFMYGLSTKAGAKEEGKKHMLWGLAGMFVMVAALAIFRMIVNFVGATGVVHI